MRGGIPASHGGEATSGASMKTTEAARVCQLVGRGRGRHQELKFLMTAIAQHVGTSRCAACCSIARPMRCASSKSVDRRLHERSQIWPFRGLLA